MIEYGLLPPAKPRKGVRPLSEPPTHIVRVETSGGYWAHVTCLCRPGDRRAWATTTLPHRDAGEVRAVVASGGGSLCSVCVDAWRRLPESRVDELGTPSMLDILAGDAA